MAAPHVPSYDVDVDAANVDPTENLADPRSMLTRRVRGGSSEVVSRRACCRRVGLEICADDNRAFLRATVAGRVLGEVGLTGDALAFFHDDHAAWVLNFKLENPVAWGGLTASAGGTMINRVLHLRVGRREVPAELYTRHASTQVFAVALLP